MMAALLSDDNGGSMALIVSTFHRVLGSPNLGHIPRVQFQVKFGRMVMRVTKPCNW